MNIQPDILIIILVTSFVQSLFGVGVLLFGTPLLLLRGYDFVATITILLPISLSINLIQIIKDYKSIHLDFYKHVLFYTIPFVIIFLFFVTKFHINITFFVGVFLLFVAIKDYSAQTNKMLTALLKYEKIYFVIMGIVHGMTNLGGSLLTAIVHGKKYEKNRTRVVIALAYATFALFQMLTLFFSGHEINIGFSGTGFYIITGIFVFLFSELLVFLEMSNHNYAKYFSVFLFLTGILLCVKSL